LAEHYLRFLPPSGSLLEIGASAHSYLPPSLSPSRFVGVGVNEEEMAANPALTDRIVQDLNADFSLPASAVPPDSFDAVLIANTMEFLVKPREVLRETWQALKPGGHLIISFASKNRVNEERQIKIWGNMNDDQRMWIVVRTSSPSSSFFSLLSAPCAPIPG
jgi:SAM-dependent methyltransferase